MNKKPHTAETKAKMSATRKGRTYTDDHCRAIGEGVRRACAERPRRHREPTAAELAYRERRRSNAMAKAESLATARGLPPAAASPRADAPRKVAKKQPAPPAPTPPPAPVAALAPPAVPEALPVAVEAVMPPRLTLELATRPTAEDLDSTPQRCNFYRWMKAQTEHDTVVGRLLQVLPWRFESEAAAPFRLKLAARMTPELGITQDVAQAAAEATLDGWRAFKAVHHA